MFKLNISLIYIFINIIQENEDKYKAIKNYLHEFHNNN